MNSVDSGLDHHSTDIPPTLQADARTIEGSLKALWEKAKRAAEVIAELRGEKRTLQARIEQLELELQHVQQELLKKEQLLRKITAEQNALESKPVALFADGERDLLAERVRALLAKLDAYL